MKGEDVRMSKRCCRGNRALSPPLLVTQAQDEDEEREEEEVDDREGYEDIDAQSGPKTFAQQRKAGEVVGRVDWHIYIHGGLKCGGGGVGEKKKKKSLTNQIILEEFFNTTPNRIQ